MGDRCELHHFSALVQKKHVTYQATISQSNKFLVHKTLTSMSGDGNIGALDKAPPDAQCSVLLLAKTNESTFVYCHLDGKRKKFRWTEMSYAKQLKRLSFTAELLRNLTYCNDKIYALSTDGASTSLVIQVDIMVKRREVITLMLFSECLPHPSYRCWCGGDIKFYLKGSCAELSYIIYYENESMNTPADVHLYKLDMASIKWEEMDDLKDANLFLDLSRDQSVSYSRVIASELG
nr:hypothetical protein [Tanacetum cinerariifolium]